MAEIAFVGRSNVGKSSLLNGLLERRSLVRTSSKPGCTRQISWFSAHCGDQALLHLVDLPGYGYAKRSKTERSRWGSLIDSYLLERPTLRAVVLLLDVRRGAEEDDLELLKMLRERPHTSRAPLQILVVATKLDKLSRSEQKPRLLEIGKQLGQPVYGFSALDKQGRNPLWRRLRKAAGVGSLSQVDAAPDSHLSQVDAAPDSNLSQVDSPTDS